MIDHIITALTSTASVTVYVDADNIFPVFRLQGSTLPAITVQLVGTDPAETKDGVTMDDHTVEVNIFHDSPRSAWKVATAIRERLEALTDAEVKEVRFLNQATDVFEATESHSVSQRYTVSMTR